MELVDVKSSTYTDYDKTNNDNDPKFKVLIMQENRNIKTFLQKVTF